MSLLTRLKGGPDEGKPPAEPAPAGATEEHPAATDAHVAAALPQDTFRTQLHHQIVEKLQKDQIDAAKTTNKDYMRERIATEVSLMLEQGKKNLSVNQTNQLIEELLNEMVGFSILEPLLNNDAISEIMVNGPNQVYIEQKGKLVMTDLKFRDNDHLMHVIERIVTPLGRRIDENSPMVDARLPDGSRVNAVIPPCALKGAALTIRKFSKRKLDVEDLLKYKTVDERMAKFLSYAVKGKLNIVVSGGTGSGKTTTLNILSSFIPNDERIVTIEDAAELRLLQDHVVSLETKPARTEGSTPVTIRDLVKNALRMRPDRIVVGECRGGEALDMLQAMNTGHDGSLTTGHANTPRDMLSRLETMVLMAGMDLPVHAIRSQIAGAVDLIIQQSRLKGGPRKITKITEVQGMEGDTIILQDIFEYVQTGFDTAGVVVGNFSPTGLIPKFADKIETNGVKIDYSIFEKK